jgi:hypothetical protein
MARELIRGNDPQSNPEDSAVYGYRIGGEFLFDPRSSADGRMTVDPLAAYGVTPEELAALDAANLELRRSIPRVGAVDPLHLADIKATYPQFYVAHTGGRCTALRLDRPDGSYLMLTGPDDAHEPEGSDATMDCGFYESDCDMEGEVITLPAREVKTWVTSQLARPLMNSFEQDQARFLSILQSWQFRFPEVTTIEQLLVHRDQLDTDDVSFLERFSQKKRVHDSDVDGPSTAP